MQENNLNARPRRSFTQTTNSRHSLLVRENPLNREFSTRHSGQHWVFGITYLRSTVGFVYLTTVMDLCDRRIIGWALSDDLETGHTSISALTMACTNHPAREGLLLPSGQGVRYCAYSFRKTLHALCPPARQSMSRTGNCWDNAVVESFFETLKRDLETLDGNYSALDFLAPDVFYWAQAA
jgi:transposase InsO family protein